MFEAYKIGVKLSLIDGVTSGILALTGHFRTLSREVDTVQGKLNRLKAGAAIGLGTAVVGAGILASLKPSLDEAKKYQQRITRMQQSGMTPQEMRSAEGAAWSVTRGTPTSSPRDALDAIMHLRMVFGDTADAIKNLPTILRMEGVLSNAGLRGDQSYEIAKTLEMIGATKTPVMFNAYADAITKGIVLAGGKVQASDYLQAVKYGRTAGTHWNKDFVEYYLPTLIQEMKSSGGFSSGSSGGPGSSLMSMYSAVVQGTVSQKALKVWDQLGLLDPSKVVWTKVHEAKGVQPGGIRGWQTFMENPFEWTQKFLVPALAKAGYTTQQQQTQAISYLFPNRTAGFVATQMAEQAWKFERDRKLIGDTKGINNYAQLMAMSPQMQEEALHKRFEALRTVVGMQLIPILLNVLPPLIHFLQRVVDLGRAHPAGLGLLIKTFAALGALLLVGGAAAAIAASIGLIATGFGAVSAIAGTLGALLIPGGALILGLGALAVGIAGLHKLFPGLPTSSAGTHFGIPGPMGAFFSAGSSWGESIANHFRSNSGHTTVHTQVNLDGKQIGHAVTQHQAGQMDKPPVAPNSFVGGLAYPSPAATGGASGHW